jgi:hypothetical protein
MKIQVTQEDINEGIQLNSFGCAIGRALQRQYPDIEASVGLMAFYLEGFSYRSTDEMITFVRNFDRDKSLVFPTEFVVDLKASYIQTSVPEFSVA